MYGLPQGKRGLHNVFPGANNKQPQIQKKLGGLFAVPGHGGLSEMVQIILSKNMPARVYLALLTRLRSRCQPLPLRPPTRRRWLRRPPGRDGTATHARRGVAPRSHGRSQRRTIFRRYGSSRSTGNSSIHLTRQTSLRSSTHAAIPARHAERRRTFA